MLRLLCSTPLLNRLCACTLLLAPPPLSLSLSLSPSLSLSLSLNPCVMRPHVSLPHRWGMSGFLPAQATKEVEFATEVKISQQLRAQLEQYMRLTERQLAGRRSVVWPLDVHWALVVFWNACALTVGLAFSDRCCCPIYTLSSPAYRLAIAGPRG